jgi:hypothetical protein
MDAPDIVQEILIKTTEHLYLITTYDSARTALNISLSMG